MDKLDNNIFEMKKRFSMIKTPNDLVQFLSYIQETYGYDTCPISIGRLYHLSKDSYCKKRYRQFTIPKKSGDVRIISAPCQELKEILQLLNYVFQNIFETHNAATGFIVGKSVVDNAKTHIGKNYVFNIDLKDFFHSFDRNRVKYGLILASRAIGIELKEPIAYLISCLCTHTININGKNRTVLPQGSPTSPTLVNILSVRLDRRLNGLARRFGLKYSRYADDITFSSDHNVYDNDDFLRELARIIKDENKYYFNDSVKVLGPELQINDKKTRLQKKHGYRQEVTGIIVNEKVNVPKHYIKSIRMWLYQLERYSYDTAQRNFLKDYYKDKKNRMHNTDKIPLIENVLMGKIQYLKMIKGNNDPTYLRFQQRYNKLFQSKKIDTILNIWEKGGIDEAIYRYNAQNTKQKKRGNRLPVICTL